MLGPAEGYWAFLDLLTAVYHMFGSAEAGAVGTSRRMMSWWSGCYIFSAWKCLWTLPPKNLAVSFSLYHRILVLAKTSRTAHKLNVSLLINVDPVPVDVISLSQDMLV